MACVVCLYLHKVQSGGYVPSSHVFNLCMIEGLDLWLFESCVKRECVLLRHLAPCTASFVKWGLRNEEVARSDALTEIG